MLIKYKVMGRIGIFTEKKFEIWVEARSKKDAMTKVNAMKARDIFNKQQLLNIDYDYEVRVFEALPKGAIIKY